ncbi:PP2C family serine/threonine-protein phosphatase [Bacteriovorax sp. DB6_IX]|uniref:PP2C family protein-serine/threonine phosphatase n=1 Tax=Bacteriovorax sp. DB6_IX TaxID=1353530 RepID=UPI000389E432|nr:SpoIIE family protein phosphatase [Bacteriovorax sp. DB6_IX]EQC51251.1 phosphoprotein phosphatase [Bacteriovorax sp. DB6_IX]
MIDIQSYFAKTHQGPYLNLNEDDILVDLNNRLFALFDGFGGSSIGDQAVDLCKKKVEGFFSKVSADPDATMPYFYSPKYLLETNALINSTFLAHEALLKENSSREMNERGGVSQILAMISENILSLVSVGNCAAFLYRNGRVSLISSPDCISPIGSIEQNITYRTFPLSALGLYEDLDPKVWEVNLQQGDKVVLLSDGIFSRLGVDDLRVILDKHGTDEHESVKSLINLSNDRGNLDNQSAIILSV